MSGVQMFKSDEPFELESGVQLPGLELAWTSLGRRAPDDSNVVWLFHALTANADPRDWWPDMVGVGKIFDPLRDYIICANVLGSCYGSSGPTSVNPASGREYLADFPIVTIRDMVRAHDLLRRHLAIKQIALGVGASLGGQQALEWAAEEPGLFKRLVLISANAEHSAWGRAFNATQRMALEADESLHSTGPDGGHRGLMAARAVAMMSYRTYESFARTQSDVASLLHNYRADSYQRYQGVKLAHRFNAWSYYRLTQAMDSHDIGRGRGGVAAALAGIEAESLLVGCSSDGLFPPAEQHRIARGLKQVRYVEIDSPYGHDGFLVESLQLQNLIKKFVPELAPATGEL